MLGHTRWASNGVIHEANAHPVDNATVSAGSPDEAPAVTDSGRFFVALNGDVDNHLDLAAELETATGRIGSPRVTTDTQVIALLVDHHVAEGASVEDAFRLAVSRLEGSAAVAMVCDLEPGLLYLSLRGSGQSLYVGLAPDGHVLSSEVYGLVHETSSYVSLDGETERVAGDRASRGTIAVLDAAGGSGLPRLLGFDGVALEDVKERNAEI
ncbi:MAG: SIS domain-containing protein, partial [Planctomycetota bacterium]